MTDTVRLGPRLGSNSIGALAFAVHNGGATLEVSGGRIKKNARVNGLKSQLLDTYCLMVFSLLFTMPA